MVPDSPQKRGFPSERSSDHPEMVGAGEALENGGFDKGTEGTLSPPASHGSCIMCRGVPAQASCCGNKYLTENRASRKKKGPRGPSCSVCHHVSWEGGGISNPSGSGQLPGPSLYPSMATLQPLSHQPMTPFAGQGLPAASLLGARAPNSCKHRNATFYVHLLSGGPGSYCDLRRHLAGSGGRLHRPTCPSNCSWFHAPTLPDLC